MKALRSHLALKNPRFECWDREKKHSLTVKLKSAVGKPATARELKSLQKVAAKEYAALEPLYREFNGLTLHMHRDTAGLAIPTIRIFRRSLRTLGRCSSRTRPNFIPSNVKAFRSRPSSQAGTT